MRRILVTLLLATLLVAGLLVALSLSVAAATPPPPAGEKEIEILEPPPTPTPTPPAKKKEPEVLEEAPPPPPRPPRELPLGTGHIDPDMDLSHLKAPEPPTFRGRQILQGLPSTFDWRAQGKVTLVKDQGACGSCYAFAAIGSFESKLLIDGAGTYDLSENNAKECAYGSPSCGGGNYYEMANLFSQKGVVLESCDPYTSTDVSCKSTCPYEKTLLDWRIIDQSGDMVATDTLKHYIYTYGPAYSSMYAGDGDAWETEFHGYTGTHVLYHPGTEDTNHAVLIVGWDDDASHDGGTGAWIAKNSWGTDWGASGYFTIAYGSARMGSNVSYLHDWQDYDNSGDIYYYDEAGWTISFGYDDGPDYGLVVITPTADPGYATRVEFWTNDVSTTVEVHIYDDFNGSSLNDELRHMPDQTFPLAGYHSVALTEPLPLTAGDTIAVKVKFANPTYAYPVVADNQGPYEVDTTYISNHGTTSWYDLGSHPTYPSDVAIRVRTSKCFVRLNDGPIGHDLQEAIDASTSSSDVVKVAGTCTGVWVRPAPSGYNGSSTVTQTAYVTKTLTIRGGYTTTNWTTSDPAANPTTLDAQAQGRVLFISGDVSPTIEGLRLTNGDATGQGGDSSGDDVGGGVYIRAATATISNSQVSGSAALNGGGLSVVEGASSIVENCTVRDNQAIRRGGGIYVYQATPLIQDTVVRDNRLTDTGNAYWGGAGIHVRSCSPIISSTQVISNSTDWYGGGIFVVNSGAAPVLQGVDVFSNTARRGGGVYIYNIASPAIAGGEVSRNRATGTGTTDGGGGLYIRDASPSISGTQVFSNTARRGGGLYVYDDATLNSIQVVSNTAQTGGGLYQYTAGQVSVINSRFERNTATQDQGGGLWIYGDVTLSETQVIRNTADDYGGGLYGNGGVAAVNSLFAANTASQGQGAALYLAAGSDTRTLRHLTVASATVGGGSAVYVAGGTANISNTIVSNYTTGLQRVGGTVNEDYNLFFGNGTDLNGSINRGGNSLFGQNPRFVDPAGGDYHIGTASAALDGGAFLGVTTDIDGDARPANPAQPDAPDIGCDENKALTVRRPVTDTVTFGAACARVVFTDTGGLSSGFITITVVPGRFPTVNPSDQVVSRTVTITPSTGAVVSATLTLCYEDSEVKSGLDESQLRLYRWTGGGWQGYTSTVDTANNLVTGSDVTAFSPWAIGDRDDAPTVVELSSFTADWDGEQVLVAWETTMEQDTVGFNVWRSETRDGGYVRVNETLIPAASPGGVWGGSYAFTDADVIPGATYYYKLEELEVSGARNWYGPVSTAGNGDNPTAVTFLPATAGRSGVAALAWWLVGAAVVVGARLAALRPRRRRW